MDKVRVYALATGFHFHHDVVGERVMVDESGKRLLYEAVVVSGLTVLQEPEVFPVPEDVPDGNAGGGPTPRS